MFIMSIFVKQWSPIPTCMGLIIFKSNLGLPLNAENCRSMKILEQGVVRFQTLHEMMELPPAQSILRDLHQVSNTVFH